MYKVIRSFRDSSDNNKLYKTGDVYPIDGAKPTKARIKALLTGENKNNKVYIEEVSEETEGEPGSETKRDTEEFE